MRKAGSPQWLDWEDTPLAVYNREADEAMDVLMLEQGGMRTSSRKGVCACVRVYVSLLLPLWLDWEDTLLAVYGAGQ